MHCGLDGRRHGVSPVPAELLLLALVVAGGVVVYIFVSGLAGNLAHGGTQPVTQELSLDAYAFPSTGPLVFTLRYVGVTSVSIQSVYFNGNPVASPGCLGTVAPGATVQCSFTPAPMPAQGMSVLVKVVSAGGGGSQVKVVDGGTS